MSSAVILDVYHTGLGMNMPEIRFQGEHRISKIKEGLSRRTGTLPQNMQLILRDSSGYTQIELDDENISLGSVIPPEAENGWVLEVTDLDENSFSASPIVTDLSLACTPKYEAASGRPEFQEFRKSRRKMFPKVKIPEATKTTGLKEAALLEEGQRVKTKAGYLGTIRYVGKCDVAAPGFFAGVELDEPKGRHDGLVKGKRLFQTEENCGILVRPYDVTVLEE